MRDLRASLFRVGLNAAKDLQRSAWRRRALPLTEDRPAPPGGLDRDQERREQLERLRDALARLNPAEKEVFLLRQNEGLTYQRIAALCHRPVGTVKTQMRSALHKLRQVLSACPAEEGG